MSLGIFGVSHLVARVDRLDDALAVTSRRGWPILFDDRAASIPSLKRKLLRADQPMCHSALVRPKRGPSIEMVEYPLPAMSRSACFTVEASGEIDPLPTLKTRLSDPGFSGVDTVVLAAKDLERTCEFWRLATGAAPFPAGNGERRLAIRAPHPTMSMEIAIIQADAQTDDALDDLGWNCIALLVRDARATAGRFEKAGARIDIPLLEIVVGGRPLRLAMLHCPDGRIVELLEPPATRLNARSEIA